MNIIVFGDSISFGQYVSPHNTWVGKMSVMLDILADKHDQKIVFQCEAVNGRTTRMALETIPQEVQKHNPDIVIVQFGLNDCNYWDSDQGVTRVSVKAFEANIEEIVIRALTFGAKKVFVNTNHPTTRTAPISSLPDLTYQQSNERFNVAIRDAVENLDDLRVELIDIEKYVFGCVSTKSLQVSDFILPPPDALHLSNLGHEHYLDVIGAPLFSEIEKQFAKKNEKY